MRTVSGLLSLAFSLIQSFMRQSDFQSGAVARNRLDHELASNRPDAFFEHLGTPAARVKFSLGEASGKPKASTVILDHQLPQAVLRREPDHHAARVAMLTHVDERFLDDPPHLPRQV